MQGHSMIAKSVAIFSAGILTPQGAQSSGRRLGCMSFQDELPPLSYKDISAPWIHHEGP